MMLTPEDLGYQPDKILQNCEAMIREGTRDHVFFVETIAGLCRRVLAAEERDVQWRAAWRQLVAAVEMTAANGHALQELSKTLTQIIYKR